MSLTAGFSRRACYARPRAPPNRFPPDDQRCPASIFHLVFDGGTLPDGREIQLQYEELDDYQFADPGAIPYYLPPTGAPRVTAALRARATAT